MQTPRSMDDRSQMEAVQLGQLVLPSQSSPTTWSRTTAVRRLALPPESERPKLYVITTPPEVRERYLRWVAIRQSALLTFLITFGVIAASAAF
jgi:hypothetical protein